MKQSAVEYAVEKLEQFIPSGNQIVIAIILEESKRMEKKQKGYSEEDMRVAHQMGANFAYGRKKATRADRVKHFDEWFETVKNK